MHLCGFLFFPLVSIALVLLPRADNWGNFLKTAGTSAVLGIVLLGSLTQCQNPLHPDLGAEVVEGATVQIQCCLASTEIIRTIKDWEPRTSTSTFTQLMSSEGATGEEEDRSVAACRTDPSLRAGFGPTRPHIRLADCMQQTPCSSQSGASPHPPLIFSRKQMRGPALQAK